MVCNRAGLDKNPGRGGEGCTAIYGLYIETGRFFKPYQPPDQRICPLCKTGLEDEEHFLMNCIAYRDPGRELFNTREEKKKKIVAKYVCYRFRERDTRVKYNLV